MKTILDIGLTATAINERLIYTCVACGITYDTARGEDAPECDCDEEARRIRDAATNEALRVYEAALAESKLVYDAERVEARRVCGAAIAAAIAKAEQRTA